MSLRISGIPAPSWISNWRPGRFLKDSSDNLFGLVRIPDSNAFGCILECLKSLGEVNLTFKPIAVREALIPTSCGHTFMCKC